ncbi:hypothetical protein D3C81_763340 [compost metagenome]
MLSDELLNYFHEIFEKDKRYLADEHILNNIIWTKCTNCGVEHARHTCPNCLTAKPTQTVTVNAKCTSTKLFETKGVILFSKVEKGILKYIYYENGKLYRENNKVAANFNVNGKTRFDIMGNSTVVGQGEMVIVVNEDGSIEKYRTGTLNGVPVFSTTNDTLYYIDKDKIVTPEKSIMNPRIEVGGVLENQTWFKVGRQLGFGFYRVGRKTFYFKFDVGKANSLVDDIKLPQIDGQLIDIDAEFSDTHILFSMSVVDKGHIVNHLHLIDSKGNVISSLVDNSSNRILSSIHGKVLGGDKVLTSSDDGIIALTNNTGRLEEAKIFTDTAPFIESGLRMIAVPEGIYTIASNKVSLIKIN